jgi:hypothetical protein
VRFGRHICEDIMRSRTLGVASLAALMVLAVASASPAGAQTVDPPATHTAKKKAAADRDARAHVTVEKRSFLDAGVEVMPGQRKFTDYAFPPGYSPTSTIDFTTGNIRGPLVGPWDTSRRNFWPW